MEASAFLTSFQSHIDLIKENGLNWDVLEKYVKKISQDTLPKSVVELLINEMKDLAKKLEESNRKVEQLENKGAQNSTTNGHQNGEPRNRKQVSTNI